MLALLDILTVWYCSVVNAVRPEQELSTCDGWFPTVDKLSRARFIVGRLRRA